jgi:beta-N-acetylhexosaminidase
VIGVRAFGAEPYLVARHSAAFVRGLQEAGVAACAKHFPGHGDTSVDSHHDVPLIDRDRAGLEACELLPFRAAIEADVKAVMTGHLLVPAYDDRLPATLSRPIMTSLLREELGFGGLIVTDGIEMQGVRRRYGLAGATVLALAAGVDAICVGGDHADEQTAILLRDAIVAAVRSGELEEQRLAEAAARVRELGAWATRSQSRTGARASADGERPTGELTAVPAAANGAASGPANGPANGAASGPANAAAARSVAIGSAVGFDAARRALKVTVAEGARLLPIDRPAHVVEFAPPRNIAIGAETPWGVGAPLDDLLPGTTSVRLTADDLDGLADPAAPVLAGAEGRALVLVTRDVHRHPWLATALARVLEARPDAIRGGDGRAGDGGGRRAHRHLRRDPRLRPGGRRAHRRKPGPRAARRLKRRIRRRRCRRTRGAPRRSGRRTGRSARPSPRGSGSAPAFVARARCRGRGPGTPGSPRCA